MHGPAEQRLLTLDRSYRRLILLRQPGEGRNLRMRHSVGHPYLIPLGVIGQSLDLAELQGHFVRRRATNRAQWRYVSVRRQRVG